MFTEVTAGTLGPSVRTIAPVKDADGKVRALVAAGVTVRTVDVAVSGRLPALLAISLALLAGGSAASWLLGRYLRRVTRGWGPEQLGQLFAYYESVLHSVREGVILIDPKGKVVMYNDQAAELLGLTKQHVRRRFSCRRGRPAPPAAGARRRRPSRSCRWPPASGSCSNRAGPRSTRST